MSYSAQLKCSKCSIGFNFADEARIIGLLALTPVPRTHRFPSILFDESHDMASVAAPRPRSRAGRACAYSTNCSISAWAMSEPQGPRRYSRADIALPAQLGRAER
jgi:hypothetical protein